MNQNALMARVVTILEEARASVAQAVNSQMVMAYWLIGRKIVLAIQGGEDRAGYGQRVLAALAAELTQRFGRGYSETYLRYFRRFYLAYADRQPSIQHSDSAELPRPDTPRVTADLQTALDPVAAWVGFSGRLSWSHYRTLCRLENRAERLFYEMEAHKAG